MATLFLCMATVKELASLQHELIIAVCSWQLVVGKSQKGEKVAFTTHINQWGTWLSFKNTQKALRPCVTKRA